jgi:outer membrane protein
MEMSAKIQQFQQTANDQLQKRNMELVQPIYSKINKAIKEVALKEGYTYIFDLSNGAVAYFSPSTKNLNSNVLQELGVKQEH